jgi:hypothetical protein
MSTEDWKLQVSVKAPNGDLINIRANTSDELSVLLEGISDYSTQIAATSKMIIGAYTAAPLVTTPSTPDTPVWATSAPAPIAAPSATPAATTTPTCVHGPRIFRSGTSSKTGQPYAFWACPTPQGTPNQCKPQN